VRAGVQQRQPHHPVGVALHIAKAEEAAVVMCDEVEAVQSERIGERADPLHFGVIGGRCVRRCGAAEAGPVGGDDAVVFGEGGDLVSPAGGALWIAVQQQHRLALARVDMHHIHFVQNSIKFAP
jgi:hypothetical protein